MTEPEDTGWQSVDEVKRARLVDPAFPEVLARVRAKARREKYDPARHGPFEDKLPPRQQREAAEQLVAVDADKALAELVARFGARATIARTGRHLEALPRDRPGVRRVAEI